MSKRYGGYIVRESNFSQGCRYCEHWTREYRFRWQAQLARVWHERFFDHRVRRSDAYWIASDILTVGDDLRAATDQYGDVVVGGKPQETDEVTE